jgi:3-dehydroquinate synthase
MKKLSVKFSDKNKNYYILIEKGILKSAKSYINALKKYNDYFIITNKTVWKLYKKYFEWVKNVVVIEDGEKYKNFDTYKYILDELLNAKIERDDVIIALGGGVVGDIAGFAASSVLRGVDFVQIPTTLLAQVDSSVGGKVAINHKTGKNLIGAFYQPKLVLIDPETLKTLDERQIKTGLGEIAKYAFIEKNCGIKNPKFLNFLMKCDIKNDDDLEKIIYHSCKLKAYVVTKDEKEKSLRAVLNFAHTFAHGIEKVTDYKVFTHGETGCFKRFN